MISKERAEEIRAKLAKTIKPLEKSLSDDTNLFVERLLKGKLTEAEVHSVLESYNVDIKDISYEMTSDGRFSPFDIIVTVPSGKSVIADIKGGLPRCGEYKIWKGQLESWNNYDTPLPKIVVFYSNKTWLVEMGKGKPYLLRWVYIKDIDTSRSIPFSSTHNVSRLINI